ncbi:insulinase family protein [Thermosipho ferrireducens]|uniref:Insulinase family protein n=2 Tax=Thermosipho ferrireducens TaxID=2571116 RepID=A0ABX7S8K5_9BACT|nr:insulinase family protein [Thermosipho ferrireducens]
MDNIRSVTIAFNIGVGAVYEPTSLLGISHFIEHASFRGTKNFTMHQLKHIIESVGGILNAWTDKENTLFYAKVPSFQAKESFDVLKEIVFSPLFSEKDIELEKEIIYQEYLSHKEDPVSNVYELMYSNLLKGPHTKSVIGTEETIKKISRDDLLSFHDEMYVPYNTKVIIVGHLENEALSYIKEKLNEKGGARTIKHTSKVLTGIVKGKKMENAKQVHLLYVRPGLSLLSEERYSAMVLNTLLSSGMSSFLFEEIREKLGLVYDIYSMNMFQKEWGLFAIYVATSLDKLDILNEKLFNLFSNFKLSDTLFEYGKKRLIGKLELSTESTSTITTMIVDYLTNDIIPESPDQLIEKVNNVTKDSVERVFEKIFLGDWSVVYVTPENENWHPKNLGVR